MCFIELYQQKWQRYSAEQLSRTRITSSARIWMGHKTQDRIALGYKCSDIKKFKVSNIPLLIIRIKPPHSITSLLPAWAVSHPSPDVTHETHFCPACVSVWLGVWIALILRGMIPALYLLYTQYICVITAITRGGWRLASQCYSPLIIVTLTHRWLDVTWLGPGAGVTG